MADGVRFILRMEMMDFIMDTLPFGHIAELRSNHWLSLAIARSADGGRGEIRTHGTLRPSGFQDRRNRPLCHPSKERKIEWRCEWEKVFPKAFRRRIALPGFAGSRDKTVAPCCALRRRGRRQSTTLPPVQEVGA